MTDAGRRCRHMHVATAGALRIKIDELRNDCSAVQHRSGSATAPTVSSSCVSHDAWWWLPAKFRPAGETS
jgi:hypothetical protein